MELKSGEGTVGVADRDRLCQMEHEQQNCCCETKGLIKEVKSESALQLERCCCDLKNMANRKSSVLSRTLLKTRKLPVSTE